jgi:hypothetical protein
MDWRCISGIAHMVPDDRFGNKNATRKVAFNVSAPGTGARLW